MHFSKSKLGIIQNCKSFKEINESIVHNFSKTFEMTHSKETGR